MKLPLSPGSIGDGAILLMPLIRLTMKVAPMTSAPVLPADTKASPLPSESRLSPRAIEEFLPDFIISFGSSCISKTSSVWTISMPLRLRPFSAAHFFIFSSLPVSMMLTPSSRTALSQPFITSRGALSPPKASTIILEANSLKLSSQRSNSTFCICAVALLLVFYPYADIGKYAHIRPHWLEVAAVEGVADIM